MGTTYHPDNEIEVFEHDIVFELASKVSRIDPKINFTDIEKLRNVLKLAEGEHNDICQMHEDVRALSNTRRSLEKFIKKIDGLSLSLKGLEENTKSIILTDFAQRRAPEIKGLYYNAGPTIGIDVSVAERFCLALLSDLERSALEQLERLPQRGNPNGGIL